ncbi:MAG: hypothetical protein ACREKE_10155 [bacterium]
MNRSFFPCLALFRTRSSLWNTLSRPWVHYPDHQVFIVTRTPARAAAFRAWAANVGVYADFPGQVAVADQESVLARGLEGGFMDLSGKAWVQGG